jgi:hypothetical protein
MDHAVMDRTRQLRSPQNRHMEHAAPHLDHHHQPSSRRMSQGTMNNGSVVDERDYPNGRGRELEESEKEEEVQEEPEDPLFRDILVGL